MDIFDAVKCYLESIKGISRIVSSTKATFVKKWDFQTNGPWNVDLMPNLGEACFNQVYC